MWILLAFGSAFFAGLTAVLAKIGIEHVDANTATALRTIVVLAFSWLMVAINGSFAQIGDISSRTLTFLILSGFATGASWLCYFKALQIGDVNKVTPIDKTSTVLTMMLAFVIFGEPLGWLQVLCMALIGLGTWLMIQKKENGDKPNLAGERYYGAWFWYAAGSAVFASLTSILGKIGVEGIDSTLGTAIRTIVVLMMAWVIVFITGKQHTVKHIDKKSWLFLILSGFATGASWLCYYRALQMGPASVVVPIDKLSILVTIAFSSFVLKEKLSLRAGAGLVLITAGTLMLLIK